MNSKIYEYFKNIYNEVDRNQTFMYSLQRTFREIFFRHITFLISSIAESDFRSNLFFILNKIRRDKTKDLYVKIFLVVKV